MRVILSTVVPHDIAQKIQYCADKAKVTQSFLIRLILERLTENDIINIALKGGIDENQ